MPSLKLYSVSDGPPSLAVRQFLKALDVQFELINVDFGKGEHMTRQYAEKNPQKEIPVLDDDGFYLSESNAILQYLADKYDKNGTFYPTDLKTRAIVNHRLCFNLSTYYKYISEYVLAPIFFDYERSLHGLKKTNIALTVFETYLQRLGKKYVAADHLTIADFPLVTATMCLEAIQFNLSRFTHITRWYNDFKKENPELWAIAESGMLEIREFNFDPPDLSHLNHPIHPTKKRVPQ